MEDEKLEQLYLEHHTASEAHAAKLIPVYIDVFLQQYPQATYRSVFKQPLNDFQSEAPINTGLAHPVPHLIEGPTTDSFGDFPIKEVLGGCTTASGVSLPHLVGKFMSPSDTIICGNVQADLAHAAANLVYARNTALSYMGRADPERHGSVFSFITDGQTIDFRVHFAVMNEEGHVEYHMSSICKTNITASEEGYNRARRQMLNIENLAKRTAESLRDDLKAHYAKHGKGGGGGDGEEQRAE